MTFSQFFMNNLFLFSLFFIFLIILISYEYLHRHDSGKVISNAIASTKINNGALLIDLRNSEDFKKGHIAGAKNIESSRFSELKQKYIKNKNIDVILYDENGYSCKTKAKELVSDGFNVFTLKDGIFGWKAENLPLV